jgi:hypothetical protein
MDLTILAKFAIVFGYQTISVFVNMITNSTLDIFIVGLIMHINAQVQILAYRLTMVSVLRNAQKIHLESQFPTDHVGRRTSRLHSSPSKIAKVMQSVVNKVHEFLISFASTVLYPMWRTCSGPACFLNSAFQSWCFA